jgi:hypothetical protein
MNPEKYTDSEKEAISLQIKNITMKQLENDYSKLVKVSLDNIEVGNRSRIGNNVVDKFTFTERLNTRGKFNMNFFEFLNNLDTFKKKKYINTLVIFYKNKKNKKNDIVVWKEIYNLCITSINIFKPLCAIDIYKLYNPHTILDFTCGWGGRLVGACALNIPNYIGIDINKNLKIPYKKMVKFLNKKSTTKIKIMFKNALKVDYSKLNYDFVLTSPPYFFIEKYRDNINYDSKDEMVDKFYKPLITKTYKHLKTNGYYCLNVNNDIYQNICLDILGEPINIIPMKKNIRNHHNYSETISVWKKI